MKGIFFDVNWREWLSQHKKYYTYIVFSVHTALLALKMFLQK